MSDLEKLLTVTEVEVFGELTLISGEKEEPVKIAEMTHVYQPAGTVMCFLQAKCPEGWKLMREKPDAELPQSCGPVITCVKQGELPAWKEVEMEEGGQEWQK